MPDSHDNRSNSQFSALTDYPKEVGKYWKAFKPGFTWIHLVSSMLITATVSIVLSILAVSLLSKEDKSTIDDLSNDIAQIQTEMSQPTAPIVIPTQMPTKRLELIYPTTVDVQDGEVRIVVSVFDEGEHLVPNYRLNLSNLTPTIVELTKQSVQTDPHGQAVIIATLLSSGDLKIQVSSEDVENQVVIFVNDENPLPEDASTEPTIDPLSIPLLVSDTLASDPNIYRVLFSTGASLFDEQDVTFELKRDTLVYKIGSVDRNASIILDVRIPKEFLELGGEIVPGDIVTVKENAELLDANGEILTTADHSFTAPLMQVDPNDENIYYVRLILYIPNVYLTVR